MLGSHLSTSISHKLGSTIVDYEPVSGGCISDASVLYLEDGRRVFCKSGTSADSMYEREAQGLALLRDALAGVIVPEVLAMDAQYLLLSYVPRGEERGQSAAQLGRALARLHRVTQSSFGLQDDNFIGATVQKNQCQSDTSWSDFYWQNRLLPQFQLAIQNGHMTPELENGLEVLRGNLPSLVGHVDTGSLLHGDLWAGNVFYSDQGLPVVIDPAVYYGDRETDIAMTFLFGGFPASFYAAYEEEFPLRDDWLERRPLYQLYHYLNHLNLFGQGYYSSVMSCLQNYL